MDYGIKIAKPGFVASTAGLGDLLFHSGYPFLKIKSVGTGSITYSHDGVSTDALVYTHDLGYIPIFTFLTQWYNIDTDAVETSYRNAPFYDQLLEGAVVTRARPYANTTQLRYEIGSYTGSGEVSKTLNYIYAVYYDPETM